MRSRFAQKHDETAASASWLLWQAQIDRPTADDEEPFSLKQKGRRTVKVGKQQPGVNTLSVSGRPIMGAGEALL